jgi:hypothetical protein
MVEDLDDYYNRMKLSEVFKAGNKRSKKKTREKGSM